MGQKVNPIGLRLGINRTWDSRWYAGKDYAKLLHEDLKLRAHRKKLPGQAGVSRVVIERPAKKPRVTIHTARPGVVIGKKGAGHRKAAQGPRQDDRPTCQPEHRRDPQAGNRRQADRREHRPAAGAPRRVPPRHEARRAVGHAPRRPGHPDQLLRPSRRRRNRARGMVSRRPRAVAHAARRYRLRRGTAKTTYGTCGVKVWVFKGEILAHDPMASEKAEAALPRSERGDAHRAAPRGERA
jgi:small subunit ribosomal protein S3